MVDISDVFSKSTLSVVDEKIVELSGRSKPRNYLGFSEIGDPCSRKLWFNYHTDFRKTFPARVLRIFERGHEIEAKIIKDLRNANFPITDCQTAYFDFNEKFKGHPDGIISGLIESSVPHIFEAKSCNNRHFKLFEKHGLRGHPEYGEKYYSQVQCYMGYAELTRSYHVLENKDNSDRLQFRTKFSRSDFNALRKKAETIIYATYPPKGISLNANIYKCKYCDFKENGCCLTKWKGELRF